MKFITALAAVFLGSTSLVAGQESSITSLVAGQESIIEIAKTAGSFNTLLAAIDAAGLTGTFDGSGAGDFSKYSY